MLLFVSLLFLKLNHVLTAAIPIQNANKESKYVFPAHMDFQKVGEITFNNEKYNVLRPSTHLVKDYFEDSLLRRDTSNFPTKRVLIDKNGFRHYWSSLENKRSMRKAVIDENVILETINNQESSKNDESTTQNDDIVTTDVPTTEKDVASTDDHTTQNDELATPQIDVETTTTAKDDEETTNDDEEATNDESTTQNDDNATTDTQSDVDNTTGNAVEITTDTTTRKRPKRTIRPKKPTTTEGPEENEALRTGGGKKGYKTSFFCPFYGVITMTSVF